MTMMKLLSVVVFMIVAIATAQDSGNNNWATTSKGLIVVNSCYDPGKQAVEFLVTFNDVIKSTDDSEEELPWMGIGYRPTEECRMVAVDKGNSKIIFVVDPDYTGGNAFVNVATANTNSSTVVTAKSLPAAYFGMLPALNDVYDNEKSAITSTYDSLVRLEAKNGFSLVKLELPTSTSTTSTAEERSSSEEDSVTLHYRQEGIMETPTQLNMMYAIGKRPKLGNHRAQACFDITEFPTCDGSASGGGASGAAEDKLESGESSSSASTTTTTTTTTMMATVLVAGMMAVTVASVLA